MADIAAGERVVVRDEEWLVRAVRTTERDGTRVEITGLSELVRDQDAMFLDHPELDVAHRLDPCDGILVADSSPSFRRTRRWLESMRRASPMPVPNTVDALAGLVVPVVVVGADTPESRMGDNVRVMTIHRAKGLEFRGVVLARLGGKDFPPSYLKKKRGEELTSGLSNLRGLLYVVVSRARERMFIAHIGPQTEMVG